MGAFRGAKNMSLSCLSIRTAFKALLFKMILYSPLCLANAKQMEFNPTATDIPNHVTLPQIQIMELNQNQNMDLKPKTFSKIPASFISLGREPSAYALIVEKLQHKLSVYRTNQLGEYEIVKTYQAVTGKKQGDKQSTGDKRTPEGIYFITGKIIGGKLPAKYGPGALTLDYPNIFDQRSSKTGYGIWIHGVKDDTRIDKAFDTDGCVALKNQDWLDLEKYISPLETPVIITKEMLLLDSPNELEEKKLAITTMLNSWKKSWENSEFVSYLNFYSDSFKTLGINKNQWIQMKSNISSVRKGKINIEISDPKILSFEDQIFVSFLQRYKSPEKEDFGRKFLYLRKENNEYKIISEKWVEEDKNKDLLSALVRQNNNGYNNK
jgi:murein L,D-transpeptidase YafK